MLHKPYPTFLKPLLPPKLTYQFNNILIQAFHNPEAVFLVSTILAHLRILEARLTSDSSRM
jgi:hypothetical protein